MANTVIIPLIVGSYSHGLSQGWYETGGAIDQAQLLLVTSTASVELSKILQPAVLLRRHVMASPNVPPRDYAASQLRMNALWSPPPMRLGELYAQVVKIVALVLLYAPLYPPFFLLGALAVSASLAGNKFALGRWWGRPPHVSVELSERLNLAMDLLFPLYIFTTWWGASIASNGGYTPAATAPLVVLTALWTLRQLLRLKGWLAYVAGCGLCERCVQSQFYVAPYDPLELTTEGIRHDDVLAIKGVKMRRYRGLAATRADEGSSGWTAQDLERRAREEMEEADLEA